LKFSSFKCSYICINVFFYLHNYKIFIFFSTEYGDEEDEEDKQRGRGKYQYNQYSNAPQLYTQTEPDHFTDQRPPDGSVDIIVGGPGEEGGGGKICVTVPGC
jgi:hypothetical protein